MDIKHLEYFVAIVENDFNLSIASKKLFVSQPALTKYIKEMEFNHDVVLFYRTNGRFRDLTEAGKILYDNAVIIMQSYQKMLTQLQEQSAQIKGTLRIGIPPVIVSTIFARLMIILTKKYPTVNFEIIEIGGLDLKTKLINQEVDLAILIEPLDLAPNRFDSIHLYHDELAVLMSKDNELSTKNQITWNDLEKYPLVLLNSTYAISPQISKRFEELNLNPKVLRTFPTWASLLEFVLHTNSLTILPRPLKDKLNNSKIICKTIVDPIEWDISLCFEKKKNQTQIEKLVQNDIVEHFSIKKSWTSSK